METRTKLLQIASCFCAFPLFIHFVAQIVWWYCAVAHLRGNIVHIP